ncbi:MAG: hypothetical protein OQJ97_12915 [Rhodospirillales bacterium]|nr:hypothetical protein [Rhodospirillales bacterium]
MIVLGLNFGHDAGISIIKDGVILTHIVRERINRAKHALGLEDSSFLTQVFNDCAIDPASVDYVAVTSTQGHGMIGAINDLEIQYAHSTNTSIEISGKLKLLYSSVGDKAVNETEEGVLDLIYSSGDTPIQKYLRGMFPAYKAVKRDELYVEPCVHNFGAIESRCDKPIGLDEINASVPKDVIGNEELSRSLHLPIVASLFGRTVPGCLIQHHACHASVAYYSSKQKHAAILSHDGGSYEEGNSHKCGMFYYGKEQKIYPLAPHNITVGVFYDLVGVHLGFDFWGAGKLMGLSSYGKPRFFDRKFVGNDHDLSQRGLTHAADKWISHCEKLANEMGYEFLKLGDPRLVLNRFIVDIASSTQKIFEETVLKACEVLYDITVKIGEVTPTVCLSGGTALNCPTNSRVFNESRFKNVFVPPACDDSGLSTGAAFFLYHNLLGFPLVEEQKEIAVSPYYGLRNSYSKEALEEAYEEYQGRVCVEYITDAAKRAVEDLMENKIIAWFEGASEVGPRALGHRSLLADPRQAKNWRRMNKVKGREHWRPFAPIVLEEKAASWFRGTPVPSPYMLFTGDVTDPRIPAVTHVDGTARIQTLNSENGKIYSVVKEFYKKTDVPVILNTSFNGPGEPIVETPKEAFNFLVSTNLDVLYIEGVRITRSKGDGEALGL